MNQHSYTLAASISASPGSQGLVNSIFPEAAFVVLYQPKWFKNSEDLVEVRDVAVDSQEEDDNAGMELFNSAEVERALRV